MTIFIKFKLVLNIPNIINYLLIIFIQTNQHFLVVALIELVLVVDIVDFLALLVVEAFALGTSGIYAPSTRSG